MTKIIVTGGMGFIGSHFVEHIHRHTDWDIVIIDKLTYASRGFERIRSAGLIHSPRLRVFTCDIANGLSQGVRMEIEDWDIKYIVHMAADTHVDNSISDPVPFIKNNVMSTVHILEYARTLKSLERFFYFSTDEVYGPAPQGVAYKETNKHTPTNPYSASKSSGEQICIAYQNTYEIPVIMVNVMNAFGERQHVEKFIPKCIKTILNRGTVQIHADSTCKISGSRFYIHARNIASAVFFLIQNGVIGELYHVSGEVEISNLDMALFIARVMGKELHFKMINFHEERPGHDMRYALNATKIKTLGWEPSVGFQQSLEKTIQWTLNNPEWLEWDL